MCVCGVGGGSCVDEVHPQPGKISQRGMEEARQAALATSEAPLFFFSKVYLIHLINVWTEEQCLSLLLPCPCLPNYMQR